MKKKEEIELFEKLDACFKDSEEIYKFSALILKFCNLNKESDDLYEISSLAEILTQKINALSLNLYRIIHKNDTPTSTIKFKN